MTGTSGTHRQTRADARAGALWGLAAGDVAASGRAAPGRDIGAALAVWDAAAQGVADPDAFAETVLDHLLSWYAEGYRFAHGAEVFPSLAAVRRNGDVASWSRLAVPERAGVSVVRAAWLGVHPQVDAERLAVTARTQALVTDAHPVAPVAAEVAAALTRALARREAVPGRVASWVRCYLGEARAAAPDPVLERVAGPEGAVLHLAAGWAALGALLLGGVDGGDAGHDAGDAGDAASPESADGALAIAVRLLDECGDGSANPRDPPTAVDRAARHGRDSASAACLLGAFHGAARGAAGGAAGGSEWVARLPVADREALTLRERGDAPRRFTAGWREPVVDGDPEPVGV